MPDKWKRLSDALGQGLANLGMRLLGVVPFEDSLTYPRIGQIARELKAQVICGEHALEKRIKNVLVAAMAPENVLPRIEPHSLMITPGDRVDNILVALNSGL